MSSSFGVGRGRIARRSHGIMNNRDDQGRITLAHVRRFADRPTMKILRSRVDTQGTILAAKWAMDQAAFGMGAWFKRHCVQG